MIVNWSIKPQFVSKVMLIEQLLLGQVLLQYKFFYEHEIFLVNDKHILEYVFVVKLLYIMLDFELKKRFHSLEIILNDIFQNNVTTPMHVNHFQKFHQRKTKIVLILNKKFSIEKFELKRKYDLPSFDGSDRVIECILCVSVTG